MFWLEKMMIQQCNKQMDHLSKLLPVAVELGGNATKIQFKETSAFECIFSRHFINESIKMLMKKYCIAVFSQKCITLEYLSIKYIAS